MQQHENLQHGLISGQLPCRENLLPKRLLARGEFLPLRFLLFLTGTVVSPPRRLLHHLFVILPKYAWHHLLLFILLSSHNQPVLILNIWFPPPGLLGLGDLRLDRCDPTATCQTHPVRTINNPFLAERGPQRVVPPQCGKACA